jgi:hypothetical protein
MKRLRHCAGMFILAFALVFSTTGLAFARATEVDCTITADPSDLYPDQKQTEVTLSVPSASYSVASDIVFNVDISDCKPHTLRKLRDMLTELYESQQAQNVDIRVGLVFFRGSAVKYLDLTDLNEVYDETLDEINKLISGEETVENLLAGTGYISNGSNMHSGLQKAEEILDADNQVDNNRKYVITVSDAITYSFNDDAGNTKCIYNYTGTDSRTGIPNYSNLFYSWCAYYGVDSGNGYDISSSGRLGQQGWDAYFETVIDRVESDGGIYDVDLREFAEYLGTAPENLRVVTSHQLTGPYADKAIPHESDYGEYSKHALSFERSIYECYKTTGDMADKGYQCFSVNPTFGNSENSMPYLVTQTMNERAGQTGEIDFDTITHEIVNVIESGTVTHTIADEFELVLNDDEAPFSMTVGDTSYEAQADDSNSNTWHFGDIQSDGTYPYDLSYNPETMTLTWDINVPVENAQNVTLRYKLNLLESPSVETSYQTDTETTLSYLDSLGNAGTAEFNHAQVTYHPPATNIIDNYDSENSGDTQVAVVEDEEPQSDEPSEDALPGLGDMGFLGLAALVCLAAVSGAVVLRKMLKKS